MLLAKLLWICCVLQKAVVSLASEACADDDDSHSVTLLQVASNLQVHGRPTKKHASSATEPAWKNSWKTMLPTAPPGKPALGGKVDVAWAISYYLFFVYLLVGLRPTCQMLVTLFLERKADSQSHGQGLEESSEAVNTTAEVAISPPPMDGKDGLLDILPADLRQKVAIVAADSRHSISYEALRSMVRDPCWEQVTKYDCVALALGPGIELATSLMCVMARTRCTPIDPNLAEDEAKFALQQFGAGCIVLDPEAAPSFVAAATALKLTTFVLERPETNSVTSFKLIPKLTAQGADKGVKEQKWNTPEDVVLLLRTSGTTGKSKVVPLLLRQVVQGARSIATSMKLGQGDVCLNAMPLFHIGGISCNFLAVLVSGGCVVCFEKTFNPRSFATLLTDEDNVGGKPTWYYATPSMHLAIADSAGSVEGHSLRVVRSGAAALTPALQERLEEMFGCVVLATCSMTECMPVASPILGESDSATRAQPLGSVGKPIGPSVEIHGGEIMLRGSLVTLGYWGAESGWKDGLFSTGDLGHIDEKGFLWLTGRKKEVINQGGETIAPQELEETVATHADVKEVAAYPVLHERLGEAVALAICLGDKCATLKSRSDLQTLAESISSILAPGRRPTLVAFVSGLSRTATGKVQRLKNPWCSQGAATKTTISGEERQIIVLDARNLTPDRYSSAKRITPEAGTIVSILDQEAASAASGESAAEEMYDSLGMLQSVGVKENFEVRLASQMYILGMLGITLSHLTSFALLSEQWADYDNLAKQTPGLFVFIDTLKHHWHIDLFFVTAGYLDAQYSPNLGARDLATYLLVLVIPAGECLHITWSGWLHPARWFLFCLCISRLHMSFQRYFNVPKLLLLVISICSSNLIQYFVKFSQAYTYYNPVPHFLAKVTMRIDGGWYKFDECIIAYVVASLWLVDSARYVASRGPRTIRGERRLGLILWIFFGVWLVKMSSDFQFLFPGQYSFEYSDTEIFFNPLRIDKMKLTMGFMDEDVLPDFRFVITTSFITTLPQVLVLFAAMAYLPVSLPDVYLNASFGALLCIPFTLTSFFQHITGYALLGMPANVFIRIFLFLCAYSVYYAMLGPLFQTVLGKAMTVATTVGTNAYQHFAPIDN